MHVLPNHGSFSRFLRQFNPRESRIHPRGSTFVLVVNRSAFFVLGIAAVVLVVALENPGIDSSRSSFQRSWNPSIWAVCQQHPNTLVWQ